VTAAISEHERYIFDTRGFLVLHGVLNRDEVATFNSHLNRLAPEQIINPDERDRALSSLLDVHPDFASLMDHEAILPYLRAFVDDKVRIDGAYALVKLPGEDVELHARPQSPRDGTGWYHVLHGEITSGLTGIQWALTDTPPGTGGFRCIPGSHKANFEVPFELLEGDAEDVPVQAGDVVIFTEALTHGSRWRGGSSRRVLIYKYCPGSVTWLSDVWNDSSRARLTPRQRKMTLPPYVLDAETSSKREVVLPKPTTDE
jgi:ectoine hydroxylase-related dioxygenase (phytanoyl-CoA dioxygenase family)